MIDTYIYESQTCKTVSFGRKGENLARRILFDLSALVAEFGAGSFEWVVRRPNESTVYIAVNKEQDGNTAILNLTATETAISGYGALELRYYVDDVIVKTIVWRTSIAASLGGGDVPDPIEDYIDQMREIAQDASESADAAGESATQAAVSATNAAGSATEAAGYAANAAASAGAAADSATDSAASASAAHTSETNAANSATAAAGSATQAANSASAAAGSASQAASSVTQAAGSASAAAGSASEASTSAAQAAASATAADRAAQDIAAASAQIQTNKGDITELKNDLTYGLDTGLILVSKTLNWINAYVNSSGVIKSSSVSKTCMVTMYAGETVTVGTQNTNIGIISSTTNDSIAINDTVTIIQKTSNINQYEEYSYTATSTINIVISVKASDYNLQFTKGTGLRTDIDNNANGVAENKHNIENGINKISTFNLHDVASNVLAYEDEDVVSGTGNYVYKTIYTYSGAFSEGDIFKIMYDSVVGETTSVPTEIRVYAGTTMLRSTNYSCTITSEDITNGVDKVVFSLYPAKGTPLPTGEATFTGVKVFKGSTVEYSITGDLRSAIENIVSSPSGGVPSYYLSNDYMSNKAKRVNELGKVGDDVFVFITDIHWQLNAKHSPALLDYLTDNCAIFKLFNGGDVSDNGISLTDNTMIKVYDMYRKTTGKAYHVAGNHDWFYPVNGKHLYYGMDSANNDQIGNPFMHYYYVDNVQQKIRYIVLNPFSREAESSTLTVLYDTEQINWFTTTALHLPDEDWDVLVFTHFLRTTTVVSNGEYIETAIANFNADTSHSGKVLAVFQGHTHWDAVYHTTSGVPVITTTCDKWDLSNESATIPAEGIAWREKNTIKEQAFDVVILNREARKFTCVRIGAPAQDNIDKYRTDTGFTWIGTLEEREITY